MSISEQVKELRAMAGQTKWATFGECTRKIYESALNEAADTIESLSAKLQAANMEQSAEDCGGGWIPVSVRPPEQKMCIDEETGEYWKSDEVLCSGYDEEEEKHVVWIDCTIDGYWELSDSYGLKPLAWMPLPEPFGTETAKESNEEQYDKIMRVSAHLIEKYGDKIWEEFGIEKTGDDFKDMFSMLKIFDEIYKREKEKHPLMWYEYCLCRNGKPE